MSFRFRCLFPVTQDHPYFLEVETLSREDLLICNQFPVTVHGQDQFGMCYLVISNERRLSMIPVPHTNHNKRKQGQREPISPLMKCCETSHTTETTITECLQERPPQTTNRNLFSSAFKEYIYLFVIVTHKM